MTRQRKMASTGHRIKAAFLQAAAEIRGPFSLFGRGHEDRLTFDVRLSAYVRSIDIPHVVISGFGANKHYPKRLVERAAEIVNEEYGATVIFVSDKCAAVIKSADALQRRSVSMH
jgi:hypothetical protein